MSFLQQALQWFLDPAHWQGTGGVPHRIGEHLLMSGASVLAAAIIALPLGIALGHRRRGGFYAINVSNVGRAIPSFALLVIALQLFGIGARPAFIALVALAIPPMVTNSYAGLMGVEADVREAARGMGMRERAVLLQVEIPIALPLIMAGVRTSAVQVVATATLAALVAWGGLGRYIVDGLAQRDFVQVFCGAVLVALLSILVEVGLGGIQALAVPRGLRLSRAPEGPAGYPDSSLAA
jgi:osmoprotectant transport system permease protein